MTTNLLFCKKVGKKLLIYVKVNRKSRLVFLLVRRRNQPTFLKKSRQKTFELGVFDGLTIGFLLYGLSSAW